MIKTNLYLDIRHSGRGMPSPLKISVSRHGKTAYYPLGISILPINWDVKTKKVKTTQPNYHNVNRFIENKKTQFDNALYDLSVSGKLTALSATRIKNAIAEILNPTNTHTFITRLRHYIINCKNERTAQLYKTTLNRIMAYDTNAERLTFEDINVDWLTDFDNFMRKTAPAVNARAVHLRNIRTIFNDAINNDITGKYPFRKYKIKKEMTKKRALTLYEIKILMSCPVMKYQKVYQDIFMLIFFLIGINIKDLLELEKIQNGRIEYRRSKTGRLYSIKVEPEAKAIIDKYKGKKKLLYIGEHRTDYLSFIRSMDKALKRIGAARIQSKDSKGRKICRQTGEGLFPNLSSYWARHTWATIASELDIPKDTIAAALGHGGYTVTDVYIDFDRRKIDDANRKIIDYITKAT